MIKSNKKDLISYSHGVRMCLIPLSRHVAMGRAGLGSEHAFGERCEMTIPTFRGSVAHKPSSRDLGLSKFCTT
jgi:hypothetical protein